MMETGGKFKREGTQVYLWLIHVDVWQKRTQYCKAIILQLKISLIIENLCCLLLRNSKFSKTEKTHRIHDRFLVVEGGICAYSV